jgi:hypothetical protein
MKTTIQGTSVPNTAHDALRESDSQSDEIRLTIADRGEGFDVSQKCSLPKPRS